MCVWYLCVLGIISRCQAGESSSCPSSLSSRASPELYCEGWGFAETTCRFKTARLNEYGWEQTGKTTRDTHTLHYTILVHTKWYQTPASVSWPMRSVTQLQLYILSWGGCCSATLHTRENKRQKFEPHLGPSAAVLLKCNRGKSIFGRTRQQAGND